MRSIGGDADDPTDDAQQRVADLTERVARQLQDVFDGSDQKDAKATEIDGLKGEAASGACYED